MTTPQLRPDVLAHPSPTTGRFLLLLGVLLASGVLVGEIVHNLFHGASWRRTALGCMETGSLDLSSCMAEAERLRAVYGLGGSVAIGLFGLLVLLLTPLYVTMRHRLKPPSPALSAAVARVAQLAAPRRAPMVMTGPAGLRDAFVFGLPGSYRLVLPKALLVRWRDGRTFDPVVRHELAHVARHDVSLAWLATAVWLAAIPVLLIPLALAGFYWDFALAGQFSWRAIVLLGVVFLARRQALRSREHDADLHAARQMGDWRPLADVLSRQSAGGGVLSNHPSIRARIDLLADPGRLRSVSFVDGLVAGFLAAMLMPQIADLLRLVIGLPSSIVAAAIVGPVLGLAVGLGLWRQAMIDHVTNRGRWPGDVVLGVVSGLIAGQLATFATIATEISAVRIPIAALLGCAGVILSAATGRLWADASARLPGGRRSWGVGLLLNTVLFAVVLWAIQDLPLFLEAVGYLEMSAMEILLAYVGTVEPLAWILTAAGGVFAVPLALRRRDAIIPAWLMDGPVRVYSGAALRPGLPMALLTSLIAAGLPVLAAAAFRLVVGPAETDGDKLSRYLLWIISGALVAAAVSLVAVLAVPRSGAVLGLIMGLFTAMLGGLELGLVNTFAWGGAVNPAFWWSTACMTVAVWFVLFLLEVPLALAVWPAPWRNVPGWLLLLFAVLGGGVVALSVVGMAALM